MPTFREVLAAANTRHAAVVKPGDERFAQLTAGRTPNFQSVKPFAEKRKPLKHFSTDDARADAEDFFDLLRNCHGGYTYFGGDETFGSALDAVRKDLRTTGAMTLLKFSSILYSRLSPVINDRHFRIGHWPLTRNVAFYHSANVRFQKDGDVFVNEKTGKRAVNVDAGRIDAECTFRFSADENGTFFWSPVAQVTNAHRDKQFTVTVKYENGETEPLMLDRTPVVRALPHVSLKRVKGIPVVKINQLGFDRAKKDRGARKFLSYAEQLRDEPVVIVDLRKNVGGNGMLPIKWLEKLTGEIVPQNHVGLSAFPYDDFIRETNESSHNQPLEDLERYYPIEPYADGAYTVMQNSPRRFIERGQILVALTSRFTFSGGEAFADLCFNMKNTLIIGTNTGGSLNFDLTFSSGLYLPRTGLPFAFGTTLIVHPDGHLPENVGIAPDVWVAGDALKAAVAMLGT